MEIYNKPFDFDLLGDVAIGRENLGEEMPVIVYRLMQYTMKETLDAVCGPKLSDEVFYIAGWRAGETFALNALDLEQEFNPFVAQLQKVMREMKIGILRVEKADLQTMNLTLTISEDLDCSGLPVTGYEVCIYDEGFIAGILYAYTGKEFTVKEVDCWATGDRTCRFTARLKD